MIEWCFYSIGAHVVSVKCAVRFAWPRNRAAFGPAESARHERCASSPLCVARCVCSSVLLSLLSLASASPLHISSRTDRPEGSMISEAAAHAAQGEAPRGGSERILKAIGTSETNCTTLSTRTTGTALCDRRTLQLTAPETLRGGDGDHAAHSAISPSRPLMLPPTPPRPLSLPLHSLSSHEHAAMWRLEGQDAAQRHRAHAAQRIREPARSLDVEPRRYTSLAGAALSGFKRERAMGTGGAPFERERVCAPSAGCIVNDAKSCL